MVPTKGRLNTTNWRNLLHPSSISCCRTVLSGLSCIPLSSPSVLKSLAKPSTQIYVFEKYLQNPFIQKPLWQKDCQNVLSYGKLSLMLSITTVTHGVLEKFNKLIFF